MPKVKKMVCHDCNNIFNRKPKNGPNQVCWKCQSTRVTLVTDKAPPVEVSTIPQAPDPSGLRMPKPSPSTGGGGITPELLRQQRDRLKAVVHEPVVLPGAANTPIARGVRALAHAVKNPIVENVEYEFIWRPRGGRNDLYAYLQKNRVDLSGPLGNIARGLMNPGHANFNDIYRNNSFDLPIRKGPRNANVLQGITYFEYGWKTRLGNENWSGYNNGRRSPYSRQDNDDCNAFLRNVRQGQIFSERLVIAETGEIFYTPDHYTTFFRYHPGTRAWYQYQSAGGSAGPAWDESFYDEPYGS
ncbi:MAG: hypothetical protein KC549_03585 [Myxococcales bacterium]|nr:hypothetical protein [Myxococcales bacterium]MCB9547555.1 hypothetical protein [Myxococcales bacterium]